MSSTNGHRSTSQVNRWRRHTLLPIFWDRGRLKLDLRQRINKFVDGIRGRHHWDGLRIPECVPQRRACVQSERKHHGE